MAVNNFKRFVGKIALVAGSTEGIGYSIAERLAREGAKVIISSRKQEKVDAATAKLQKKGLDVTGVVCHVGNPSERSQLLKEAEKFGRLDILMINAGVNASVTSVLDTPETAWDKNFDVNVKSAFLLTKEALPLIKNSSSGRIIYMGSVACFAFPDVLAVYGISKTALLSMTKFAAVQLGKYNITVNSVVPSVIDTRFGEVLLKNAELRKAIVESTPIKRFGTPEDVSNTVAFLASDEASYISGENIVIAGGMPTRL